MSFPSRSKLDRHESRDLRRTFRRKPHLEVLEGRALLSGYKFTEVMDPRAIAIYPYGINNAGQISGSYSSSQPGYGGFLGNTAGGSPTLFALPGAASTQAIGINDAGQIVGAYDDVQGHHGFLLNTVGGLPITIGTSGAILTEAYAINASGQIVGQYEDAQRQYHGFA
jgi:uncharacterized membrane protein